MNKYFIQLGNNARELLIPALERRGNWSETSEDSSADFIWKPVNFHKSEDDQVHNHLENHKFITTKTGLISALRHFYDTHNPVLFSGYSASDSFPTSYIITAQIEDSEYDQFVSRFKELALHNFSGEKTPEKHCLQNMWLIKPAALNQGRGIIICRDLNEILTFFRNRPLHSLWVVQKYIEKPLLFKNRKFDIRIWALATARNDFFYYRKGYLRTSSSEYSLGINDSYIHLTNNCLQQLGEDYGLHETGNTLSFEDFEVYLSDNYPEINFEKHIMSRMKDLMIDTFLSGKNILNRGKKNLCFELLGFDFLIDEDFRVWLIEVNTNPYLGVPNKYIAKTLPLMIDDMLAITLDLHHPPAVSRERTTNDFRLLYCESGSIFSPDSIERNARQSYTVSLYPTRQKQAGKIRNRKENSTENTADRLMRQIKDWKNLPIEQVLSCLNALKALMNNHGISFLVNHARVFIVCIENAEEFIKKHLLDALVIGCSYKFFKKEIVSLGVCRILVNFTLNEMSNLRTEALEVLKLICDCPNKKIYIPGETPDCLLIWKFILNEGVPLTFLIIKQEFSHVVQPILNSFEIQDWEKQLEIIDKIKAGKKNFPEFLIKHKSLDQAKIEIENICQAIKSQRKFRLEKEKEKLKEKEKKEIEQKMAHHERKLRAEQYINKRYEEIRIQKLNDRKNIKDNRFSEEQRELLLEKVRQYQQNHAIRKQKLKEREISIMKEKEKILKEKEEMGKKAFEEWTRKKIEIERKRKILEIQKSEKFKQFQKVDRKLN